MMKKSLVSFIFAIIIFLISFLAIIAIYIHFLNTNEKYYCYNLYKTFSADIPEDCKKYIPIAEKVYLNYSNIDEIEKALAIYISRCWVRGNRGLKKENIVCFSIEVISDINDFINFTRVKNYVNEYSDLEINRIFILPNNPETILLPDRKTIIILYNVTNIIVW